MDAPSRELIAAVIWFMIGFGAGLFILSMWKYLLIAVVAAIILPIALAAFGVALPITPEAVMNALLTGIEMLADVLARNRYSLYGFVAGAALGLAVAVLRLKNSMKGS